MGNVGRTDYITRRTLLVSAARLAAAAAVAPALITRLPALAGPVGITADVRAAGARGDGMTDDTRAIQAAVDRVRAQGGGTVLFPPGTYQITTVNIYPGITYLGDRATIKRPDDPDTKLGRSLRTFNTRDPQYSGSTDSPPLIIRNLVFDGNIDRQGPKNRTDQAHLLFLQAAHHSPGRLKVLIDNCTFQNSPADAITTYVNVDLEIKNTVAQNCRRGALVFNGGNTKARVSNFRAIAGRQRSRIDMEIASGGYNRSQAVELTLDTVYCDGNVEFENFGGTLNVINAQFVGPLFNLFGRGVGKAQFRNSVIHLGPNQDNRIQAPGSVVFDKCRFVASRSEARSIQRAFRAFRVMWDGKQGQLVRIVDCDFVVDPATVSPGNVVVAVHTTVDPANSGNRLVVEGGSIAEGFDTAFQMERGGTWTIRGTAIRSPKAFKLNAPRGFPYHVVLDRVAVRGGALTRTLSGEGTGFEYP
jgi:hypothetical protein